MVACSKPPLPNALGAATAKLRVTDVAAAKVPLPPWFAVIVQVPTATKVNVLPVTVQTGAVEDVKVTASPDVAVADSAGGAVPSVWSPGPAKLMVWAVRGAGFTVKLRTTDVAAAKVALPAWLAVIVQVPADASVSVVPLTVHTGSVLDVSVTARPELELATKAGGAVPSVWSPGLLKLMVCAVSGAASTEKLRDTSTAAAKMALPGWRASIVQVPKVSSVSVVPLTVHTAGVVDVKDTTRPEVAVATSAGAGVPSVWLAGPTKLMVCAAADTAKLRDTGVAAAKPALPGWLASTVQVPAATSASVVPLTVHTAGVVELKTTTRPEVELAVRADGADPSVCAPGELKVMTCAAAATVKVCATGAAAAKTALPGWLALTEQLPAATRVSVLPLTVHTAGVVDAKDTGRPEVALATKAGAATPRVWLPDDAKLMLCEAAATLKVLDTVGAAAKVELPGWLALRLQLPAATKVRVLPVTAHTPGVVEAKLTASPELAVADRAAGVVPSVCEPGDGKLMVWMA